VVVLLHGFPQPATVWAEVAESLAAAGFRVIAPYLRGYCDGAVPPRARDYSLDRAASDVLALIRHCGLERVHLAGQDWGGAVAWMFGSSYRDFLSSLTVVSMLHPKALPRALATTLQAFKSWYIGLFVLPSVAEFVLRLRHGRFAR